MFHIIKTINTTLRCFNSNSVNNVLCKRFLSVHVNNEEFLGIKFQSDYTKAQQDYLLSVLNKSSQDELLRFNLSKNRIKKIDAWRNKYGSFKTITDVLEVDGLSVKMLNQLCRAIIETKDSDVESKQPPMKARGQLLSPLLNADKVEEIQSVLGIHLYTSGASWSRIEKENNSLTHWDYYNYNNNKKMSPTEALQIVLEVCDVMPPSDLYVFEAQMSVTPTAQQSPIPVTAYAQRVQLLSMLTAVLSTNPKHNPQYIKSVLAKVSQRENDAIIRKSIEPIVYFLRHRVPARLFRTLIGNEKVSVASTISKILGDEPEKSPHYTPIELSDDIREMYNSEQAVNKEVLGQALILNITFLDLFVHQNLKSIKMLSSKKI